VREHPETPTLMTVFMAPVVVAILAGRYGADSREGFGPGSRPWT
jgi:hypothetical protein